MAAAVAAALLVATLLAAAVAAAALAATATAALTEHHVAREDLDRGALVALLVPQERHCSCPATVTGSPFAAFLESQSP